MRCPSCGHKNSDLATRCASCGSALPITAGDTARHPHAPSDATFAQHPSPVDDTAPHPPIPDDVLEDTARRSHAVGDVAQGTAPRPYVPGATESTDPPSNASHDPQRTASSTAQQDQAAAAPSVDAEPQFRHVASTAGKYAAAKRRHASDFFHAHQRTIGLVAALLVVCILGAVWLTINLLDAPTYTSIEKDIAAAIPTYTYAGGTYGPDLEIPLSSVAVTKRTGTRTPEGMEASERVGSVAYDVEAEATYDDGKMHVVRNVDTTYVHKDDSWHMTGELADRGLSLSARSGVDESKVLASLDSILDAVSKSEDISLAELYEDGSFSIVGNSFKEAANKDTATNDVTIHCSKQDGFVAYEGNVTARFAFEWSHKFEVTIDSVGDASSNGKVTGSITVLAHYHGKLTNKADSSEGDKLVERVPFTGVINTDRDKKTGNDLRLEATTTGTAEGELSFVMSFGTSDDPSEVTAKVTTTHTYQETVLFFIPHQTTSKFVDNYLVSRT